MEYYTKSEGLGFLIRKSRIDFRIEFRGVSILCEFNPSTKTRYGHTRTHQRPLVFHDHLVSHDRHQTTLWLHSNPSTSVPLIQRFQSLCHVTQMTTRRSYRDSGTSAGDVSNNTTVKWCSKDEFVKWAKGVSNLVQVTESHSSDPVFYRQENSAFNRQSTMAWSHMSNVTWPSMAIFMAIFLQTVPHDPSKLFCSINGSNFKWYDMARGWPQQWFDKCSKRTFLQTFTFQS